MNENKITLGFLTKSGELVSCENIRGIIKCEILDGSTEEEAKEYAKEFVRRVSENNIKIYGNGDVNESTT